ncbi:hypothetical protein BDK51DRAFT_45342 [Blyttiomyces helicus]|uniref:RNI-like protein n=1 Tax=Blyttiomyces helicus TaxID=388810 RepID=A0A4P9VUM3_9FUNG|nr:hypothetical protein BDK51DRAFT_45342 [Blyttiomyces helicus]|eukprot:RKO83291.1 hypothetical protein BDK51DRAFT_45342 [Blyttiomyces helicus]
MSNSGSITETVDFASHVLACGLWRDLPLSQGRTVPKPRTWGATPPRRAAVPVSIASAWNVVGTEVLWRTVDIGSDARDSLARFVTLFRQNAKGYRMGQAPLGSYVRAIGIETWPISDASGDLLLSMPVRHFPNLRCANIIGDDLSLSSLAFLFECCPNLVVLSFRGDFKYSEDAARQEFWSVDFTGKVICKGVHRLQALELETSDPNLLTAAHGATGPNLLSWSATARYAGLVATNSPNLKILSCNYNVLGANLLPITVDDIKTVAASYHQLVAIDLSRGKDRVTDDAIQALLHHCPAISELNLSNTAVTIATILLEQPFLFANGDAIAFGELLSARGASLTRLRIGMPGWRMDLDLAILLSDSCTNFRSLSLVGSPSASSVAWLAPRLLALRNLEVQNVKELKASIPSRVSLHSAGMSLQFYLLAMMWDKLAGTLPP